MGAALRLEFDQLPELRREKARPQLRLVSGQALLQKDPHPGVLDIPATVVNAYAYAGNNPLNITDPSGMFWGELLGVILIAAAVVVTGGAVLGIIAAAGAVGGFVGGAAGALVGGAIGGAAGALVGSLIGAAGGALAGGLIGGGGHLLGGGSFGSSFADAFASGAALGAVVGAAVGGAIGGYYGSAAGSYAGSWQRRGGAQGSMYNTQSGEVLRPDVPHGKIGPHVDYRNPRGNWNRIFPDGNIVPKKLP